MVERMDGVMSFTRNPFVHHLFCFSLQKGSQIQNQQTAKLVKLDDSTVSLSYRNNAEIYNEPTNQTLALMIISSYGPPVLVLLTGVAGILGDVSTHLLFSHQKPRPDN